MNLSIIAMVFRFIISPSEDLAAHLPKDLSETFQKLQSLGEATLCAILVVVLDVLYQAHQFMKSWHPVLFHLQYSNVPSSAKLRTQRNTTWQNYTHDTSQIQHQPRRNANIPLRHANIYSCGVHRYSHSVQLGRADGGAVLCAGCVSISTSTRQHKCNQGQDTIRNTYSGHCTKKQSKTARKNTVPSNVTKTAQ